MRRDKKKSNEKGLDLAAKDDQGNILRIVQGGKHMRNLLQCTEVVSIDVNGQDRIRRFICQ